ncbi:YhdP family protein [Paludibacterium purpuratum]|uniref:YhdP family protein n=1 Tax=Paludibacterium purpuratum TaxID=1144873 RepID=UPI001414D876|nr:YhdP family protein [Paludibacterium purpuratum]
MKKLIGLFSHLPVIHTLKRLLKLSAWVFGLAASAVTVGFLLFTFQVLPNLDHYRLALARQAGQALGRQVTIGRISGAWDGLAPRFELSALSIADPHGAPLTLDRIAVVPSWQSLIAFEPRMALIELSSPALDIRRGRDGRFYLNGFPLSGNGARAAGESHPGDWLLRQSRIVVTGARIAWQDEFLGLPKLTLSDGKLELASGLLGHDLQLSGKPPATVGDNVELSGSWHGDELDHWQQWRGSVSASLHGARVSPWSRYLQPFGLIKRGEGDGSVELSFADGRINRLVADVKVRNAAYALPGAAELSLPALAGRLQLERSGDVYQVNASHLSLLSASGPVFTDSNINGFWDTGTPGGGEMRVDNVNLAHLSPFLHALGVDRNPLFSHFSPSGQLKNLSLGWQGHPDAPTRYRFESSFSNLAWQPSGQVPGVDGLSGSVKFDQDGGQLRLSAAETVQLPHVFAKPLHFSSLAADVGWRSSGQSLQVDIDQWQFANADLRGRFAGHYRRAGSGAGTIDLTGGIDHVLATRVVDYLPYQAGADTIRWLSGALKAGTLENAQLRLRGDLDRFPFKGGQGGEFLVSGTVRGASLLFDKNWPLLSGFDASLVFHNERMDIKSSQVQTLGNRLTQVQVAIPDLGGADPHLTIQGQASGELANMLRYTAHSPVDGWLSGFLGKTRATGQAALRLNLSIPLSSRGQPKVDGQLHLMDNQLALTSLPLPPLQSVNGVLGFSEHGVSSSGIALKAFGGPFVLKAESDANARMRFVVDGQADSRQVVARYVDFLAPHISGNSHYQARFTLHGGLESLQVGSDLVGTRVDAPSAPLSKAAAAALPFNLTLMPVRNGGMRLDFSAGSQIAGRTRFDADGTALGTEVAIGRALSDQPSSGVRIKAALPQIDARAWSDWSLATAGASVDSAGLPPLHIEVATPLLTWGPYSLHRASLWLGHEPGDEEWHAMVDAAEIQGAIDYDPRNNGSIHARLPLVVLNQPFARDSSSGAPTSLPAMDIRIGKLVYKGNALGSLTVNARYVARDWLLDNVTLTLPEGSLSGSVRVLDAGSVDTRFKVQASDVGKLLAHFGLKETFNRGQGSLSGSLSWPGGLGDFDAANASGQMSTDLSDGRFAKVDPGVARLLGVLSLQSLPRRIHLDFTDVFSEGFAFDSLRGDATISRGIFKSDNLVMKGPGADVNIKGVVNLATETQQLQVHVEPHLSEGVALATGAALINPVVGVAALAAQKVLRDPVSKIFSVDYSVSGTFAEPVVARIKSTTLTNTLRKLKP